MSKGLSIFPRGKAMNKPEPIFHDNAHGDNLVLEVVEKLSRRDFGHKVSPASCWQILTPRVRAVTADHPRMKRGYVGPMPTDCLSPFDYRSADFIGPMVAA